MEEFAQDEGYKVPEEFQENTNEPLVDFTVTENTELWLVSWPKDVNPDFHGTELSLKLHDHGDLGSLQSESGKEYGVSSSVDQGTKATVFLSSPSGTKIAGKISRNVCLVHYPEPSELVEKRNAKKMKKMYPASSSGTLLTQSSSKYATPTRSTMTRNSGGGRSAATHSISAKSHISGIGEPSQHRKKSRVPEPTKSVNRSSQSSGRGQSAVTSLGQGSSGVSSLRQGSSGVSSIGQGHSAATSSGETKSKKRSKDKN